MKIRCAIVSTSEWLRAKGRWPDTTFPCIEWFVICRYVSWGSWRADYQSCSPCPVEAILFFGQWWLKEGLPLGNTRDVRFSLMGPINWAGRTAQIEATINTVQEGHWVISHVVTEKRTKVREPGHCHRTMEVMRTPTAAYDIKEWMQGIEEDAPKVEVRSGNAINHRSEWVNVHLQHAGWVCRWHRRQERPQFPRNKSDGSPSSWVGIPIGEAIEVPSSQPWWECQEKVTDQCGWEGVLGWWSICQPSRMKRPKMLLLTTHGGGT